MPIFEDECYADVRWAAGDAPPALYSLAPAQVIHIGSFSKSLAPALRVGYVIADWSVLSQLLACKGDGGTGALEQMVVAEYFSQSFDDHLARLTPALRGKLDTLVEALEKEFGTDVEIFMPEGGIFLWVKLPDEVDVRSFAAAALEQGVAFNPGPDWACDPEEARSHMRLCFALPSKQQIREGIAELARICHAHTGRPRRSANVARG
ncbi:aminotransferase class I/II-fold pyridoxal phosphate-dependent enzyme [Fodinicurvata halophila]|uniref:aminotransferase class I/II-fold pyridoxal phosphate-dependent enzyme n=1 Tax=Fodinicurvata halophila TaxID=1419723 RepID=UPI003641682A